MRSSWSSNPRGLLVLLACLLPGLVGWANITTNIVGRQIRETTPPGDNQILVYDAASKSWNYETPLAGTGNVTQTPSTGITINGGSSAVFGVDFTLGLDIPAISASVTPTWANVQGKPSTFTPATHATSHQSGGSDVVDIEAMQALTDVTTHNATTLKHGFLKKLSGSSLEYMDGSGNWSTPPGSTFSGEMGTTTLGYLTDTSGKVEVWDTNGIYLTNNAGGGFGVTLLGTGDGFLGVTTSVSISGNGTIQFNPTGGGELQPGRMLYLGNSSEIRAEAGFEYNFTTNVFTAPHTSFTGTTTANATISSFSTVAGVVYVTTGGLLQQTAQGAAGLPLTGNDAGTPVFTTLTVTGLASSVTDRLLPTSPTTGDSIYWNGSAWAKQPIGGEGEVYTVVSGIPDWAPATGGGGGSSIILQNQGVTLGTTITTVNLSTHFIAQQQGTYGAALLLATGSVTPDILAADAVTSAKVADGTLVAGDMASSVTDRLNPAPSAAGRTVYDNGSAWAALAAGTANQMYQANGAAAPSWVTIGGDLTQSGGTFTIAANAITSGKINDGAIVNDDVNASAAIALSKLAFIATDRLLGRVSASAGAIEEITISDFVQSTLDDADAGTFRATISAASTSHASTHASGGSDAVQLDNLASPDDNTDLNATTSAHGLLRKLDNDATHFLDGQGNWTVPAGSGGGGNSVIVKLAGSTVGTTMTTLDFGTAFNVVSAGTNYARLDIATGGVTTTAVLDGTLTATDMASSVTDRLNPAPSAAGRTVYDNGSAWTALAAGTANQMYQANGAAAPGWVTVGGDVTQSGGTFTVANNAITSAKINDGAVTVLDVTADVSNRLLAPGGTAGDTTYTNGTNWLRLAAGSSTQVLHSGSTPSWSAIVSGDITDGTITVLDVTADVSNRLHAPGGVAGDLSTSDGTNWKRLAQGSASTVLQVSSGGTLQYGTVTSAMVTDATLTASDLAASVTGLLLPSGTTGDVPYYTGAAWASRAVGAEATIFQVNGSSVPAWVALSGDATIATGGALTIANNAITSAKISDGVVSALDCTTDVSNRLNAPGGVAGDLATSNGTNWLRLAQGSASTVLQVSSGGTLQYGTVTSAMVTDATLTTTDMATSVTDKLNPAPSGAGKVIYDNGTAYVAATAGTSTQILHGGTAPSFSAVVSADITDGTITSLDCTSDVSNRLMAPGGVSGDVPFSNGTNWKRLAKGTDGHVLTLASGLPSWAAASAATTTARPPYISGGYVTRVGTNLVFQPDVSNRVYCYESSTWTEKTITAAGIATGCTGLTANVTYNIYCWDNSGTMSIELSTTANVTQDGIPVKSGATSRTALGIVATNASGDVETYIQNTAVQNICNYYNKRSYALYKKETTDSWTATSTAGRALNNDTNNKINFVTDGKVCVNAKAGLYFKVVTTANNWCAAAIGLDSSTVDSSTMKLGTAASTLAAVVNTPDSSVAFYDGVPSSGSHYLTAMEQASVVSTGPTIYGDGGATPNGYGQSGITATLHGM